MSQKRSGAAWIFGFLFFVSVTYIAFFSTPKPDVAKAIASQAGAAKDQPQKKSGPADFQSSVIEPAPGFFVVRFYDNGDWRYVPKSAPTSDLTSLVGQGIPKDLIRQLVPQIPASPDQ